MKAVWLVISMFFLSGCGRDEQLYRFGAFSFTIFLLMIGALASIKYIHHSEYILSIFRRFAPIVLFFSRILRALSIFLIIIGSFLLFFGENSPEKLTFFLGVVLYSIGHFLAKWANDSKEKKAENWRYVSLSFGFAIVIIYIMVGAPGLK